nr:PREDICTED: AT-hook motif nuclear-localized protein 1-like [Daucus carota subsp. sativus]
MEGEGVIHYGPGAATEGVTPVNAEGKKKRRRPKKHGRESPRGGQVAFSVDAANFDSRVVTVDPGEDVAVKLMSISRREARTVRVLGGSGAVSVVTLRHLNPYGDTMIYEGSYGMFFLSGYFTPKDIGGKKAIVGSMTVSLAGPNGSVMGGVLAGSLIAAAPVQVVITSFRPSNEEPKQFAPTSSLVPATGDGETRGAKTG